ncbi:MAG: TIR domain-containing protein [Bacteroidales bacterium]|nr:TIR domain-containing protein [Bacteroidales bacterium]
MSKDKINIFISHYGGDEKYINSFKGMIGDAYDVRDSSIVETDPNKAKDEQYIKYQILAPKIDWAGKVVVLIGPNTHERDYVNWEIEYALKQSKQIIGVFLPGASRSDIPEGLDKFGDYLVTWDHDKIISAINGEKISWENADGTQRPSITTQRGVC